MNFGNLHCCGISEIQYLNQHSSSKDAMIAFCRNQLEVGSFHFRAKSYTGAIYSHYLFTAAVYPGSTKGVTRSKQPYGDEFAAFIRENGLGTVVESPSVVNKAWHKDHEVKCWIWTVDEQALRNWWASTKKGSK